MGNTVTMRIVILSDQQRPNISSVKNINLKTLSVVSIIDFFTSKR